MTGNTTRDQCAGLALDPKYFCVTKHVKIHEIKGATIVRSRSSAGSVGFYTDKKAVCWNFWADEHSRKL